jgi:hypothetical protein
MVVERLETVVLLQKHSSFQHRTRYFGLRLTGRPQFVGKWSMTVLGVEITEEARRRACAFWSDVSNLYRFGKIRKNPREKRASGSLIDTSTSTTVLSHQKNSYGSTCEHTGHQLMFPVRRSRL